MISWTEATSASWAWAGARILVLTEAFQKRVAQRNSCQRVFIGTKGRQSDRQGRFEIGVVNMFALKHEWKHLVIGTCVVEDLIHYSMFWYRVSVFWSDLFNG